jgi:MarR family transcriptional regulator, organic hydroperoxide resistance regulator
MDLRLDQHLCFSLYAASRAMTQAYAPHLGKLGLTYPQYLVLLALSEEGPSTVSRLGERLQLDSGTLSPLLKRLQEHGLLQRERDAADERRVLVRLTSEGVRQCRRACAVPPELFGRIGLSVAGARKLKQQIDFLTTALKGIQAERTPP